MTSTEPAAANEAWQFRAAVYFVCTVQVLAALFEITRGTPVTVAIGAVLLAGAVGLFRKLRWARGLSVVFLWMLLVFSIVMVFPARIEGDQAMGLESPTMPELVAQLIVLSGVALGSLHLLAKYKPLFRPGRF